MNKARILPLPLFFYCFAAIAADVNDSTKVQSSAGMRSACTTVDGIVVDGSPGTPVSPPYNGGNWFASVSAASAYFGRTLKANGPNSCITDCGATGACTTNPTCTPKVVTDPSAACGVGYTGTKFTTTTTTCPNGPQGTPVVTTSGYNTSGCVAQPVQCVASTASVGIACPAGFNGTTTQTTTVMCPDGSYGAPIIVNTYNYSNCSTTPSPGTGCAAVTHGPYTLPTGTPGQRVTVYGNGTGGAGTVTGGGGATTGGGGVGPSCWQCTGSTWIQNSQTACAPSVPATCPTTTVTNVTTYFPKGAPSCVLTAGANGTTRTCYWGETTDGSFDNGTQMWQGVTTTHACANGAWSPTTVQFMHPVFP